MISNYEFVMRKYNYYFPKLFSYSYGWRFRLLIFENEECDCPIYDSYFNAPSMVLARQIVNNFRADFLINNEITDDYFIFDLYNISLGDRRKL